MNFAESSPPSAANAAARSRSSRLPVAWLRMCSSSPMFSPWAARSKTSTGPRRSSSAREPRPEFVAEEPQPLDRLVVADAEPQRPARSLVERGERARSSRPRRPTPASTVSRRRSSAPRGRARCRAPARSRRARAAAAPPRGSAAQPSNSTAATSARRCGSQTRSHVIGGPECSSSAVAHARHDVARRRDGDRARRRALDRGDGARVGLGDRVAVLAPEPREQRDGVGVAARRRAPVDVDDRRALRRAARRRTSRGRD